MKRMHVNLTVADLDASIRFYSALFAADPAVVKGDYAKWMLDDPRVNFSITSRGARKGIDHLGIQVESDGELKDVYARLRGAEAPVFEQGETTCCYAQSNKSWTYDPEGIAWEAFLTTGESAVFGEGCAQSSAGAAACCPPPTSQEAIAAGACCEPATKAAVKERTGCCV